MSVAELTREQHDAIQTRSVSVAVSAGAGCGKTFVLTERFLSHLLPDETNAARLTQLIAITFTDAAAREMRSRIRSACYERLRAATAGDQQQHWLALLREIDTARVSTIHGFCASLLRAHAAAAGLDPLFGVLDQSDADVLQFDVIDDVLREQLAALDDKTLDLAAACGLARLKQQIAVLMGHRYDDSFQEWLDATPEQIVANWRTWNDRQAFPNALREIAAEAPIEQLLELLRGADARGKKAEFIDARAALLELLPRLANYSITPSELAAIPEYAKVSGICTAKEWEPAESYGKYRDACQELRELIKKHTPKHFDPQIARRTAELGLALLQLTNQVVEKYQARKMAQGKLDFDDLLSAAHTLLTDPKNDALRRQLSDDLRLLLVDEFQDTDQLQVDLVKALCGPGFDVGRLFFVGDFKQSIYRFRGAQPQVFRDLRAEVKKQGRLPLTLNFRSQPAILHFVNALFCDTFRVEGQEYEALRPDRAQTTEPKAVEFLWTIAPDKNNTKIPGSADEARRKEARAIAGRLRTLLDPNCTERPVVDKNSKQPRQLQPGDVAILFRTLSDVQVYEEALRECELDYYLVGGHAFYAQQEIYDVLNLLRAVASTADEVSLAGVLRSPFFALSDETLFWLVESAGSLNAGLLQENLPPQLSADERGKTAAAAATISYLRDVKDRVPIATLLGRALDRTGYDAVLLAEFLGQRKLANLHKLMERARAADHGGVIDLAGFITQLGQFIAQQPKEALAATLPEAANVIRLMTIHHAKGLEFRLVVVPDLDRRPHLGMPAAALHPELGPLVPPPGDDEELKNFATGMSLFGALEKAEELEERKRLLYVACTRAADYLILSSSLAACDRPISDWMKLLSQRFDLETGELVSSLPDEYDTPAVGVKIDPTFDHKPASRSRGPDLVKMLDDAHQLATHMDGVVPPAVAPIIVDQAARRQFSFSRLSGRIVQTDVYDDRAGATQPLRSIIDPRGLGSLVHEVMARIDYDDASSIADWSEHLAPQLVMFDADDAARLTTEMIARFAGSPRGRELAKANAVHREVEFILAWPPGRTNGNASYLRGFIDCLYQDADGRWRLSDYKTNDVAAADVPRIAKRYELQMYVYAMAAERALGEPPAELVLHFMRPGVEHVLPWNDAARGQAIEMVNNAMIAASSRNDEDLIVSEVEFCSF